MKLASLKAGRDGRLVVVSRDLARAVAADGIAPTLQSALERWAEVEPALRDLAGRLEAGAAEGAFPFDEAACAAPLPRAYQWLDGSAYVTHVELVRKARGATLPERFWTDPLMYQGASDRFMGPRDPIEATSENWGLDFEAEVAVVTDDVPMGTPASLAGRHIRLVVLVNDVSARALIPDELAKGFGFVHGKPASAFSPVAVTPDELGKAWRDYKLCLPLLSFVNGKPFGRPDAGVDMTFDFTRLIEHAAKTRYLSAGTIIGSGTVANGAARDEASGIGHSCIAERRMLETIWRGEPETPWLRFGDRVRIEMKDAAGRSIFGAIEQEVVRYTPPVARDPGAGDER
ncbi:fumarylacetoacetate hydrolase family protein [Benzoatithermus flavus]|uniref:Fumarylacetoacetate hydrolase family protein n=1 Tax=Benzoatithermus flavus TaxID=3108223 RepID=A0ABU8XUV6_9PROT